ncbi:MAG: hypothetical protein NC222_06760 [Staphylococcus sp.]|nr:hypothetical protein [Staphylococcus sp.]
MFEEFKEKRRIYKLIKKNKDKLKFTRSYDNNLFYYTSYHFSCSNKLELALMKHRIKTFKYVKHFYSVFINGCFIDGWYGWKLERMLKKVMSMHKKEKRIKELAKISEL